MIHVEQGELQAYLDAEVTASARAQIEAHVATCADCAAEAAQLRSASRIFASAVRTADVPAPAFAALTAVRAVAPVSKHNSRFAGVSLARAAMMVLGFGALASAAIPGSPLRNWFGTALRNVGVIETPSTATVPVTPETVPVETPAETPQSASLSIAPVDGRVLVVLTNVSEDADIQVDLVDSGRASVQANGRAASARFRTGAGRIEVVGVTGGQIVIELPRTATDARVEVDGRTLYPR